jgi:group I intron endonuclease
MANSGEGKTPKPKLNLPKSEWISFLEKDPHVTIDMLISRSTDDIILQIPKPVHHIYKFTSPTGKSYIGRSKNPEVRIAQHLEGHGSQPLLLDLIELGRKSFTITLLETVYSDSADLANLVEDFYIDKFHAISNGYNLTMTREPSPTGTITNDRFSLKAKYVFSSLTTHIFTVAAKTLRMEYERAMTLHGFLKARNLEHLCKHKNLETNEFFSIECTGGFAFKKNKVYNLELSLGSTLTIVEAM